MPASEEEVFKMQLSCLGFMAMGTQALQDAYTIGKSGHT